MKRKAPEEDSIEYIHPFRDHKGDFCNIVLKTSDNKEIKTDRVTLASWSSVFLDALTLEEKGVSELLVPWNYEIVSAALWITEEARDHETHDEDVNIEGIDPFAKNAKWMMDLMKFGVGYELEYVTLFCVKWLDPENRPDSYSIEEVLEIRKFMSDFADTSGTKDVVSHCNEFLCTHSDDTLSKILEPLPLEAREIVNLIHQSQDDYVRPWDVLQYLWSLSTLESKQPLEDLVESARLDEKERKCLVELMKEYRAFQAPAMTAFCLNHVLTANKEKRKAVQVAQAIIDVLAS